MNLTVMQVGCGLWPTLAILAVSARMRHQRGPCQGTSSVRLCPRSADFDRCTLMAVALEGENQPAEYGQPQRPCVWLRIWGETSELRGSERIAVCFI